MAPFFYLGFAAVSAFLLVRRFEGAPDPAMRVLSGLVLWAVLYLLPVHLAAALQIAGWLQTVQITPLAFFQAAVLAVVAVWSFLRRTSRTESQPTRSSPPSPQFAGYLVAGAIVVGGASLIFAAQMLVAFPDDPDALAYHIPVALHWLQEGSLRIPASLAWEFSLPANTEIGMMMLLAAGAQRFLSLVNLLAAIVLGLSTYLIAKKCTTNRLGAASATLIALSIPIVQFQAFSAYIDLYATAFLLAGTALFIYRYDDDLDHPRLALARLMLAALACGISIGSKSTFYLYGGVFFLASAAVLIRDRSSHKRFAWGLLLLVVGLSAPSVFWIGRSWLTTGNPVYPLPVIFHGRTILAGNPNITPVNYEENFVRSRAEWLIYPWTEWKKSPGYLLIPYSTGSGLGGAFATFVPLGLVFAVGVSCTRGPRGPTVLKVLVILWWALLICWWFGLRRVPRFGLPLWVLACALCSPLLVALDQGRSRRIFRVLFVISLASTCAISSFVPLHTLLAGLREGDLSRSKFYDYPKTIDNLPAGTRLANEAGGDYNFVLAGSKLTNEVIPDFELPANLTNTYLRQMHADFVIQRLDAAQAGPSPPCDGLELVREEVLKVGEAGRRDRWRIWRVE